jgi:hypothetical protein
MIHPARPTLAEVPLADLFLDRDDAPVSVWGSIHPSPGTEPATVGGPPEAVVPLTYDRREAARRLRKTQPKS